MFLKGPVNDLRFLYPSLKECLWQALKSRDIDLVISDHSPCTVDLKLMDRGDFMAAWGGISSVQYGKCLIRESSFNMTRGGMKILAERGALKKLGGGGWAPKICILQNQQEVGGGGAPKKLSR